MKNKLSSIFGRSAVGVYILLAFCCLNLLPVSIKTTVMIKQENFLSSNTISFSYILGLSLCALFLSLAFFSLREEADNFFHRILKVLSGLLPAVGVVYLALYLANLIQNNFEPASESATKTIILMIVVLVIALLISTYFLFTTVYFVSLGKFSKGYFGAFIALIKMPHLYLVWFLMAALFLFTNYITDWLMVRFLLALQITLTLNMLRHFIESFMCALVLFLTVIFMRNRTLARYKGNLEEPEKKGPYFITKAIYLVVSLVLCIVVTILGNKAENSSDPEQLVEEDIGYYSHYGALLLASEEYEEAFQYFDAASDHIEAWEAYFSEDAEKLKQLHLKEPYDALIMQLYAELTNDYKELELNLLRNSANNADQRELLLVCLNNAKSSELSKYEEGYKTELSESFAASEHFTRQLIVPAKIGEKKKEKILKYCEENHILRSYADALSIINISTKNHLIEDSDVIKLCNLSDANEEDRALAYFAGLLAASGANDDASYYNRAAICIERYISLLDDKKLDKATKKVGRINAINLLIKVKAYESAIRYINEFEDEISDDTDSLKFTLLYCYEMLGDSKKCYELSKELLYTKDISIYYYYGVGALMEENVDEVIDALLLLSEMVKDSSIDEDMQYKAESAMFILSEYLVLNDNSTWTKFQYAVYSNLTDDQKAKLEKDPFLNNYVASMYNYYVKKNYEEAKKQITSVLSTKPYLPMANFIYGNICYNLKDFETSVNAYLKAIDAIDNVPMFYYALASSYDGWGKYEEAYAASVKAYNMVPTVNHEDDWYGIGYHNQRLMEGLKNLVGGEE